MLLFSPSSPGRSKAPAYGKDFRNPGAEPIPLPAGIPSRFNVPQFLYNLVDETQPYKYINVGPQFNTQADAIPGPLVRTQPVAGKAYPGLTYPPESQHEVTADSFYRYSYGSSPYWRFANWSPVWPEYFQVTGSIVANVSITIGEEPDDDTFNYGMVKTFDQLLRRSDGYEFPNEDLAYADLSNPNIPCCATWTPVGVSDHYANHMYLRFSPLLNYVQFPQSPQYAPFSWHIAIVDFTSLSRVAILYFDPRPSSGSFRLTYGTSTGIVNWFSSSTTLDIVTAIEGVFDLPPSGGFSNTGLATATVLVDTSEQLIIQLSITHPTYSELTVTQVALTGGSVSVVNYSDPGTIRALRGNLLRAVPATAFNTFTNQGARTAYDGACNDSRDAITPLTNPPTPAIHINSGDILSQYGLAYGSLKPTGTTIFRGFDIFVDQQLDDTSIENPGFPFYVPIIGSREWQITSVQGEVSVTPVYL